MNSPASALVALIAFISSTTVLALTEDLSESSCASKLNNDDRLLCFDELAKQSKTCEKVASPEQRLHCYDSKAVADGVLKTLPADEHRTLAERRYVEQALIEDDDNPWLIVPHRQTYILPISYLSSGVNTAPYQGESSGGTSFEDGMKDYEAKYQISFAVPLWRNMFGSNSELLFGYTQISVWQIYSGDISSPFRDTNYEPELIWRTLVNKKMGDVSFDTFSLSLDHQSNGRADPLSKSWNRIIANFVFSTENWAVALRPWYRIPENAEDDNNPDIEKYMGYGELWSWYKINNNTFGLMLRNNFRTDDNVSTVQLDWSFLIHSKLKGYVQYFNGYGETLIDYNYRNERIGAGIMLVNVF